MTVPACECEPRESDGECVTSEDNVGRVKTGESWGCDKVGMYGELGLTDGWCEVG